MAWNSPNLEVGYSVDAATIIHRELVNFVTHIATHKQYEYSKLLVFWDYKGL